MADTPEFRVGAQIGGGGFCVVYEAGFYDASGTLIGPPLAIKYLKPEHAQDPEVLARFQREARIMHDDLSHPNIVRVVGRNLSEANPWFVMEKAQCSLMDELDAGKGTDEGWVIDKFRQILEAIAYAHEKAVIHRDLKPQNALVYADRVCVSDFGLGKHLMDGTNGLTKTNMWSGTEPYMAPEQFADMKHTTEAADVFSLGKLLMHMLIGTQPVVGQPDVAGLPERFRYFVQRCCSAKPENRFSTAREALVAFDRIFAGLTLTANCEEILAQLVEEWWVLEEDSGEEFAKLREIDEHLRSNASDEPMYTRAVPQLPEQLVDQYMSNLPEEFADMLAVYDDHISGGLPFEYCDTVANFYRDIFATTEDIGIRRRVLQRLYLMGWSHNRWYVRQVLLTLLHEHKDVTTTQIMLEVIEADPQATDFLGASASHYDLAQAIVKALSTQGP